MCGRAPILRIALAALVMPFLVSCGSDRPEPVAPQETEIPEELRQQSAPPRQPADEARLGSPMEDRVATLGLLNKRNNLSQDVELKPGEQRRIGDVVLRLSSCERTAPWEMPRETGGFVQVIVRDSGGEQAWRRVFSGWLFKESPSLNVVEHPIYDVWMKDCAMTFPGDDAGSPDAEDGRPELSPEASPETSET